MQRSISAVFRCIFAVSVRYGWEGYLGSDCRRSSTSAGPAAAVVCNKRASYFTSFSISVRTAWVALSSTVLMAWLALTLPPSAMITVVFTLAFRP